MYTLDTNAIIYYLRGDVSAIPELESVFAQPSPIYISAVTEAELFSFSLLSNNEMMQIEKLLRTLSIIPFDSHLARLSGLIRRHYRLKLPDSMIAATALFTGSTLVTRNIKDFRKIPNLLVLHI